MVNVNYQAKAETVEKVWKIVRKQLALPDDTAVTGESKFAATICSQFTHYFLNIMRKILLFHKFVVFLCLYEMLMHT